MALFGGKRTVLQRAEQARWRNDEEKRALIEELEQTRLRAEDALNLMWHQDAAIRQVAVEAFVAKASVGSVMQLCKSMDQQGSAQRTFAGRVLQRLDTGLVTPAVEKLIKDKQPRMQRLGWEVALNMGGPGAVGWLTRAVTEAPLAMRAAAVRRLLQVASPAQCIEVLLEAAEADDPRVSGAALEALLTVNDPRVQTIMLRRLEADDGAAREHARRWLKEAARHQPETLREAMLHMLAEGEDATRRACIDVLLETGDHTKVLAEICVFLHGLMGWIRDRVVQTLQTYGKQLLEPSLALLQHPDDAVRSTALLVAERFNDPRMAGSLCRMLQDPDWWLKVSASDSLGQLRDARTVPWLVQSLDDPDCCWAAIEALGRIGHASCLAPLTRLLTSDRSELRIEVVNALAGFEDDRLFTLLEAVRTQDPVAEVRTRAAEVMRKLAEQAHRQLDEQEEVTVSTDHLTRPMDQLLARMRKMGGSDLHVSVGEPPLMRARGKLDRMEDLPKLDAKRTESLIRSILSERQLKILDAEGEVDFCYAIPEVGRYRANAFKQRLGLCASFRAIPNVPPTFNDLRIPGHLTEVLDYHQGIIIVSGPAGSGKSTTLAAFVNLINETKPVHVLTLEEPIEFVHPAKTALVNQREVGKHSETFHRALRGALREDPDVIMVGELRDPESIRLALEAAETGHVVLTTMHTTSAIQTVERLVSSFPPEEQPQVRMGLSEALKFVVCQQLVPRADGEGRCAVFEILKGTFSVGNLIRDDKCYQLGSAMQVGRNVGMQSVDMALMDLVEGKFITPEVAWAKADGPDKFEPLCSAEFIEQTRSMSDG